MSKSWFKFLPIQEHSILDAVISPLSVSLFVTFRVKSGTTMAENARDIPMTKWNAAAATAAVIYK